MDEFPSHFRELKHKIVRKFLTKIQPKVLLDVGAGVGLTERLLRVPLGTWFIALDCDRESLQFWPGEKVLADAVYCPFKGESVDVILILDVLEHIQRDDSVLSNCWKVLTAGGLLFISVPQKNQPLCFISPEEEDHIRSGYLIHELHAKAKSIGFTLIYGTYIHSAFIALVEDSLQKIAKTATRNMSIPGMKGFSSDLADTKGVMVYVYTMIFKYLAPLRTWIELKTPPSLMRSLFLVLKK